MSSKHKSKENNTSDSILMAVVIIFLIKNTIDLFVFDLLPPVGDNIFWVFISFILILIFYIKRSYIHLCIMLVILLVGILNF
ncbi:hypothetical protein [Litchfieldia salsa]|uniref:hypothetical protein n=1 Tax=Litchfieldia salsa TaxID=930152 RepID=UPI000B84A086|nr:hypothetical protein [Litchfieldia salsa]